MEDKDQDTELKESNPYQILNRNPTALETTSITPNGSVQTKESLPHVYDQLQKHEPGDHLNDVPAPTPSKAASPFMSAILPPALTAQSAKNTLFHRLSPEDIAFEKQFHDYLHIKDGHLVTDDPNAEVNIVARFQRALLAGCKDHKSAVWRVIATVFFVGFSVYLGFAISHSLEGATALIVITCLVIVFLVYNFIRDHWGDAIYDTIIAPVSKWWDDNWHIIQWFLIPALILALVLYLTLSLIKDLRQLQSISGFIIFFLFLFVTSEHPNKIVWRPVIWGYSLQFLMGILVLQWRPGYEAVKWVADLITKIINYGFEGAAVVYGDPMMVLHPYIMMGMSLLIYMGSLMSILYYIGVTGVVAKKMAWLMQVSMKTTAIESLSVASNILLNGMDVLMMLRFYLDRLTMSEINCFMVGNSSTIAGFMFGLLILFGAPPQHLLSGAVMSAPAAIAIAKLSFPESTPHLSQTRDMDTIVLDKGEEANLFEAAANGSAVAGRTAFNVVVNYISFIGTLSLLDGFLGWIGNMVGFSELSFEWLCSYLFWPISLIIGIEISQCREVAKIIGLKVFTTEMFAYQVLGQSFSSGRLDARSRAIATYALCGFSSLSTLSIGVGVWDGVCNKRRPIAASLMVKVLVQANLACFTTAAVAGLFYSEDLAIFENEPESDSGIGGLLGWIWDLIPKYKDLLDLGDG